MHKSPLLPAQTAECEELLLSLHTGTCCMRSLLFTSRRRWRLTAFRLCSILVGVLLVFHATSCGFLFCVHLPLSWRLSGDLYDDLRDISVLAGTTG